MTLSLNPMSATMSVLVGEKFACIRITGRANFTSSIDFRNLLTELRNKGFSYFVLDLAACTLMDSTFLGVLAGFGLKMNPSGTETDKGGLELLNPNPRLVDLLDNLGVLHLFKLVQGSYATLEQTQVLCPTPSNPSREEVTLACLEAHQTLMAINPDNVARFKDVTQFMAEDLKKLRAAKATE